MNASLLIDQKLQLLLDLLDHSGVILLVLLGHIICGKSKLVFLSMFFMTLFLSMFLL